MKLLKVGDKVYRMGRKEIYSVYTIDRVTKTTAFCGVNKFDIEYSDSGWVYTKPKEQGWFSSAYYVENEEIKDLLKRQVALRKIKCASFDKMTTGQLYQLVETFEGFELKPKEAPISN